MKQDLRVLYELQAIDIKIANIEAQLVAMDGAKAYRRKYSVAKAAFEAAEKQLLAAETEIKDNELKLKTIDEKRTSNEKRLYNGSISNPKELNAVEKEIQQLKDQQAELDPRLLELYEQAETLKAQVASAKENLDVAEKQARAAIKNESIEKAKLEAELADLTPKREADIQKVSDKAILSRYEAIRKRVGSPAIAKAIEGKCDGCHVSITGYTMRSLYTTDELQTCENCGRILMLEL